MQVFLSTFWSCSTWWRWLGWDGTSKKQDHCLYLASGYEPAPHPAAMSEQAEFWA